MKKVFDLTLSLWQGKENIDFNMPELTNEINKGVVGYNTRFAGFKVLEINKITKGTILLTLTVIIASINEKVEVSRAITYFSHYMYHSLGWGTKSKVKKRLFTVIESTEKIINETDSEINNVKPILVTDKEIDVVVRGLEDNSIKIENIDIDLRKARLEWLYSTRNYIELEIKNLEVSVFNTNK